MIYTISKKEGHQTIEDFLLKHSEFKMVREAQLFPYEELDTALYYAVMKKETPLAKVETPLGELTPGADKALPLSSAKSE